MILLNFVSSTCEFVVLLTENESIGSRPYSIFSRYFYGEILHVILMSNFRILNFVNGTCELVKYSILSECKYTDSR